MPNYVQKHDGPISRFVNVLTWEEFVALCDSAWCLFYTTGQVLEADAPEKLTDSLEFKAMGCDEVVFTVRPEDNAAVELFNSKTLIVTDSIGEKHHVWILRREEDILGHVEQKLKAPPPNFTGPSEKVLKLEIRADTKAGVDEALDMAVQLYRVEGFTYNHREKDDGTAQLTIELFDEKKEYRK